MSSFENDMKLAPIDKRCWRDSGIMVGMDINIATNLEFLFNVYVDECYKNDKNKFSIVFMTILFKKLNKNRERLNINGSIYFDINDFLKSVDDNYERVEYGLKGLPNIDWESEAYHIVCTSYYYKLESILRHEDSAKNYIANITHSLPVDITRDNKINNILDEKYKN